jgi:hypothetical protein
VFRRGQIVGAGRPHPLRPRLRPPAARSPAFAPAAVAFSPAKCSSDGRNTFTANRPLAVVQRTRAVELEGPENVIESVTLTYDFFELVQ